MMPRPTRIECELASLVSADVGDVIAEEGQKDRPDVGRPSVRLCATKCRAGCPPSPASGRRPAERTGDAVRSARRCRPACRAGVLRMNACNSAREHLLEWLGLLLFGGFGLQHGGGSGGDRMVGRFVQPVVFEAQLQAIVFDVRAPLRLRAPQSPSVRAARP